MYRDLVASTNLRPHFEGKGGKSSLDSSWTLCEHTVRVRAATHPVSAAWCRVMNRGKIRKMIDLSPAAGCLRFVKIPLNSPSMSNVRIAAVCLLAEAPTVIVRSPETDLSLFIGSVDGRRIPLYVRATASIGLISRGAQEKRAMRRQTCLSYRATGRSNACNLRGGLCTGPLRHRAQRGSSCQTTDTNLRRGAKAIELRVSQRGFALFPILGNRPHRSYGDLIRIRSAGATDRKIVGKIRLPWPRAEIPEKRPLNRGISLG